MNDSKTQANWPVLIVGDYLFEPTIGLISGPGGAHRVCSRTSALLNYFIQHHNQVVARADLISELWHDAPGADKALNRSIARLRNYFGDTARAARYVETVPTRGYRLVAAVYGSELSHAKTRRKAVRKSNATGHGRLRNFLAELRDRKVCRAMLLYTVAVWLIAQVSEIIEPALSLPDWFTSFVVVVGILGFPIAAVLAWIFEITPEGLVFDVPRASDRADSPERSRSELLIDTALVGCAAFLSAQLFISSFSEATEDPTSQRVAPIAEPQVSSPHVIAIAPLTISGAGPRAQAMALRLVDQMTATLLGTEELVVVSRGAFDPLSRERLARQDVDSVLQGLIYTEGTRTRISLYLVDAESDVFLMNSVFSDRELAAKGLEAIVEQTTSAIVTLVTRDGSEAEDSGGGTTVAAAAP